MCEHSMLALHVWPLYVSTLCVTTLCEHSMCDHSMGALYVWPLYGEHSMCDHSMWALCVWPLYVSTGCCRTPKSTKITTKNEHQFLGRMLQNTEKYENYHKKWTSVLGPDVAAPKNVKKSTSFIVKTPFKTIAEHRKVRELPR